MALNPANFPLLDDFAAGLGAAWSANELDTDSGGIITTTGGAAGGTSGRSGYITATYAKPMGVRAKLSVLPTGTAGVCLWLVQTGNTATPTGYRFRYDPVGADFQIQRVVAGTGTFFNGDDIADKPISAGDEIALGIDSDNSVMSWVFHGGSWVLIDSDIDGSALSGPFSPGLEINDAVVRVDAFYGGQETAPPAGVPAGAACTVGAGG
jgi:hypothetical protein